jgi:hypothetical protein
MMAGMPGTGIGGMFYVLLTLFMPIRELYRAIRGKSDWKRWQFILLQLGFVGGITGGMIGECWLLGKFFVWIQQFGDKAGWALTLARARMMAFIIPGGAMLSLALVIVLFFLLRFLVRLNEKSKIAASARAAAQRDAV